MEVESGAKRKDEKLEEMLEEKEAIESGVTLIFASAHDEFITMVPHTSYCFQSTHFLSARPEICISQKVEKVEEENS